MKASLNLKSMKFITSIGFAFIALTGCYTQSIPGSQPLGKSGLFNEILFHGKKYFVCEVNPHHYKIEVFNRREDGAGIYDLNTLAVVKKDELLLVMNGGMYQQDMRPVGLLVSNGKTYHELNLNVNGKGNFHELSPNGIFMLDSLNTPFVLTTGKYISGNYTPWLATQSGPMLVIDGVFNSHFKKGSANLNIRNGAGVNKKGNVVLVVSEEPVNFYELAELYRDILNCNNALYLDGFVSQYYAPELHAKPKAGYPLAVFITVSKHSLTAHDQ